VNGKNKKINKELKLMMTRVNKNATALCVAVFSEYLVQDANQQVDSGQTAEPHAVSSDIEPSTNEPPTVSCDQASEHEMQQAETQHQHLVADNVPLSNLLNQFVIVLYEGNPYPGKVIDVDEQQGICKSVVCIALDLIASSGRAKLIFAGMSMTILYL